MATLNVTPDSFSDGGTNNTIVNAVSYALRAVEDGADIIDVGGYSTRPGAADISAQEEISRVVPSIQALRDAGITVPISIDTFRADVARAALEAGANCINDVRGLRGERMKEVAAEMGVPVIMMHSRGVDVRLDDDYTALGGAVKGARSELGTEVRRALQTGVRRWNVIVDPGIGFSKGLQGNLQLIRDLKDFTAPPPPSQRISARAAYPVSFAAHMHASERSDPLSGIPTLIGTSRKSYLGKLIGRPADPPAERGSATIAASVAAIQNGCDMIRVHDVRAGKDAALVGDALWRTGQPS